MRCSSSASGTAPPAPPLSPQSPTYHTATQPEPLSDYDDAENNITKIPLSEEVPWLPRPIYSSHSESRTSTQVTTLDNGIRVATEPKFGSFCTVGGKY